MLGICSIFCNLCWDICSRISCHIHFHFHIFLPSRWHLLTLDIGLIFRRFISKDWSLWVHLRSYLYLHVFADRILPDFVLLQIKRCFSIAVYNFRNAIFNLHKAECWSLPPSVIGYVLQCRPTFINIFPNYKGTKLCFICPHRRCHSQKHHAHKESESQFSRAPCRSLFTNLIDFLCDYYTV